LGIIDKRATGVPCLLGSGVGGVTSHAGRRDHPALWGAILGRSRGPIRSTR